MPTCDLCWAAFADEAELAAHVEAEGAQDRWMGAAWEVSQTFLPPFPIQRMSGNNVDNMSETVFTYLMTTNHHMSYCDSPEGHDGICFAAEDRRPSAPITAVIDSLAGSAIVIVRGKHRNEPGVVVACNSGGRGGSHRTVDVLLGRTGERVTVLRTSVEVFA